MRPQILILAESGSHRSRVLGPVVALSEAGMDVTVLAPDPSGPVGRVVQLSVFAAANLVEPAGPAREVVGRTDAWQRTSARLERARLRREQRRREARELGGRRLRALARLEHLRVLTHESRTLAEGAYRRLPDISRSVVESLVHRLPDLPVFLAPPNSRMPDLDIVDLLEHGRWEVLHVQEPRFADVAARAVARRRADGDPAAWVLDLDRVPDSAETIASYWPRGLAGGPSQGREAARAPAADAFIAATPALATAVQERFRLSQAPTVLTWVGTPEDSSRLTALYRDLLEGDGADETVDPTLSATLATTAALRAQARAALMLEAGASVSDSPAQGA